MNILHGSGNMYRYLVFTNLIENGTLYDELKNSVNRQCETTMCFLGDDCQKSVV